MVSPSRADDVESAYTIKNLPL